MGFDVTTYFDGTTFPVRVDHRFPFPRFSVLTGNVVNASAPGNSGGNGSDGFRFALVQRNTGVGMATEWRVVLHEFGHSILWDNVNSPNFVFAHSAGDSLAAILNDPTSNGPDRGVTFPWTPIARRHDRPVAQGWAWGGTRDDPFPVGHPLSGDQAGYDREQILSSTLFRLYQSTGGAHAQLTERTAAARHTTFLIFSAVVSLSPFAQPLDAEDFADDLMDADLTASIFEGLPGGVVHKVIRWAFEQQGAYQLPGAPTPVSTPGAAPAVDVFLDDGRNGDYQANAQFVSASQEIWNRRNADGASAHEDPAPGQTNFLYARVRNRGTAAAQNVEARAFVGMPGSNRIWPGGVVSLTPATASLASVLPPGGNSIIGPFQWSPDVAGGYALVVSVGATDDANNLDSITDAVPLDKLLHCDNNAALREVSVSPSINAGGVVNSASFQPGSVSPGEIVTVFGSRLGPAQGLGISVDPSGNVATQLGPTRVLFDGQAAALVFVQQNQVSAVAPFALAGQASTVHVEVNGNLSNAVVLPVAASHPGVFALAQTGAGQGAVLNQDGGVNGAGNPAAIGSVISIYATGGGQTTPAATDAQLAPTSPLHQLMGGCPELR